MDVFFSESYRELVESPNGKFWFMNMPLPDGRRIAGLDTDRHREQKLWHSCFPDRARVRGRRVLDIGANDGYFSIAACLAGAAHVTALNTDQLNTQSWPANIELAARAWNVSPEIVTGDFLAHEPDSPYDIVLCLGVLYHVENVFAAAKKLRRLLQPDGVLCVETQLTRQRAAGPIFELASDRLPTTVPQYALGLDTLGNSNFLIPNEAAVVALFQSYGMTARPLGKNAYEKTRPTRRIFTVTID
ncbi:MAG: class I SAM-dependent methyltransferase [Gemmataceae bacterium]